MNQKTKSNIGLGITILLGVVLLASAGNKLMGNKDAILHGIGILNVPLLAGIEIICALLFLIPKTNKIGFLLVTAYFGGAITGEWCMGEFPLVGIVLQSLNWIGHYLRNPSVFK